MRTNAARTRTCTCDNSVTPTNHRFVPFGTLLTDAPKLIPLSALERYQEGADLRLFCSASASPSAGRIQFEWRKNQAEQLDSPMIQGKRLPQGRAHVSLMDDDSASVLRINHLEADDSGNYTCLARNQHGFDSSTVRVNVHG